MKKFLILIPLAGVLAAACNSSGTSEPAPSSSSTTTTTGTTGGTTAAATTGATAAGGTTFATVAPVFNANCMPCHSADKHRGGLSLADSAGVMKGGDDGPVVKAGDPDNSLIVKLLHGPNDNPKIPQMPMGGKQISASDIQTITNWVKDGAKP